MGWFSSICSAVGSFCSSVCGSIGTALTSFATGVASTIGGIITAASGVASVLCRVGAGLLHGLGVFNKVDKVEDIGDRAIQAAEKGITMDQFPNFDAYLAKLRDTELDPEKSKKSTDAEKITAGLGVGTVGMEDKLGMLRGSLNSVWALPIANPDYFTANRLQSFITSGRFGGDVFAYLEKHMNGNEAWSFEKGLEVGLDSNTPAARSELYEQLDKAKENMAKLSEQVQTHLHNR